MYENLNIFRLSGALASQSSGQQSIAARNIANANTPGYTAQRSAPFEIGTSATATLTPRTTRSEHLGQFVSAAGWQEPGQIASFDQHNTVSIEQEMVNATIAGQNHEKALAVYRHGMTVLRSVLGKA